MIAFFRKPSSAAQGDWYRDASPADRQEYDAFGPWLHAVRSPVDMPPRFLPWYAEHGQARFLLKIPRDAERRTVRPGQDLYRAVLAVHPDRVCLLSLEGETVGIREAAIDRVLAIRNFHSLLQAEFGLPLADGTSLSIDYNSVSLDLMEEVVDYLRSRLAARHPVTVTAGQPEIGIVADPLVVEDYYFHNLLVSHRKRNRLAVVVHVERPGIRCRDEKGRRRRSLGCVVLDCGTELVLVWRGRSMRRSREAVQAQEDLHIPYSSIRSADLGERPAGKQGNNPVLRLGLESGAVEIDLNEPAGRLMDCLAARRRNLI